MSEISNRIMVTAIDDGTTLHANLVASGQITQAWNGVSAVPDWTVAANQPTLYLTLLSGGTYKAPTTYTWKYNGTALTFNASTHKDPSGKFMETTQQVGGVNMPALKIVGNLVSSNNVDLDTITLEGTVEVGGASLDFNVMQQVRITKINAQGYLGVINFVDGIADITEEGQTLTLYGKLYGGDGQEAQGYTTNWYLGSSTTPTPGQTINAGTPTTAYANAYQVTEANVVDHAVVRCDFIINNEVKYSAFVGIDDMKDSEFMYIQYSGANGNSATLHYGQSAVFSIWVGTHDDPSVLGGASNPAYGTFKTKIYDGLGNLITGAKGSLPAEGTAGTGLRNLTTSQGKAELTFTYADVFDANIGKKNMTAVIYAYSS